MATIHVLPAYKMLSDALRYTAGNGYAVCIIGPRFALMPVTNPLAPELAAEPKPELAAEPKPATRATKKPATRATKKGA